MSKTRKRQTPEERKIEDEDTRAFFKSYKRRSIGNGIEHFINCQLKIKTEMIKTMVQKFFISMKIIINNIDNRPLVMYELSKLINIFDYLSDEYLDLTGYSNNFDKTNNNIYKTIVDTGRLIDISEKFIDNTMKYVKTR